MSYVAMGAYNATLRIPEFKGLYQHGDGISNDPRYAAECSNALTAGGVLAPIAACELLPGVLPEPIETLAMLHRRWYTADNEHDVLIAACSGQLYWALPDGQEWRRIPLPADMVEEEWAGSRWSCVAYEINPEGSEAPVDVLLMSNAKDGMICLRGDNLTVTKVATPKKFGIIARHAERIWGGAIENDPDMLMYSAPYDPFNWVQNDEIPEDGAGDIQQPSWDGDSFTGLMPFGSQLIATKRTRLWRVIGTNPGEYVFSEQYGGGTAYPYTVAVDGARILMLGRRGVMQYDGESVAPYYQEYAAGVFRRMNIHKLDKAFACMYRGTWYCALPLDGAEENNAVLMYNTTEKTWLLREDVQAETFLPTENALYFTSATFPGRLYRWRENCLEDGGTAQPMRWASPWMDFGYKNMAKGSFTIYITAECTEPVTLGVSVQTEKKCKEKTLTVTPPLEGQQPKQKRMVFGGNGRRFRLILKSDGSVPWRLLGGLQVEAETDTD